jgi:biopolymer transport protein TolR
MAFAQFRPTQTPQAFSEINVTPLVDVMLVLVVILILTAPLLASSIRLTLPASEAAQPVDAAPFLAVTVDRSGQAYLGDLRVSPAQLRERLAEQAARYPDTEVQLRADAAVPYGKVVEVMGLAQKAGLYRIGFVAEPKP